MYFKIAFDRVANLLFHGISGVVASFRFATVMENSDLVNRFLKVLGNLGNFCIKSGMF